MQTRAHLVDLVEKFCVQTQYTYTYTTELWATPSGLGQGRKEQRSTSEIQFIQSFTTVLQCCVSWFCPVDVFLKGEVNSAGTLHTDGKLTAKESEINKTILELLIHSWGFTVIFQVTPCYLLTLDKRQSSWNFPRHGKCCALVYLLQFSNPVAHKTSYFWGKFSYGTGSYAVCKYYFIFSSLNSLFILKIYEIHFMFAILYGIIMHTNVHSLL